MKPLDGTETDEDPRGSGPRGRLVWAVVPGWTLTWERLSAGLFAPGPYGLRARCLLF